MPSRSLPLVLVALLLCNCSEKKAGNGKGPTPPAPDPTEKKLLTAEELAAKTHSGGMERFKDPGVYVDGVAVGVLKFGELPVPLEPVWFEERAAVAFRAGDPGPRYRIAKQRRYRFSDYFRALGVDLAKVQELHIYGGNKRAAAVVIPGDSLRDVEGFLFRFGGDIWGKPLPACPAGVGDGKCPDQIGSVALYVDKVPPVRKGPDFYLDGVKLKGIPYHGEPLRGGVRVYMDGPLAATIKRNKLAASNIKPIGSGETPAYRLFEFLKSQKVDTDKVQEAWLIHYERRVRRLSREELLSLTFTASPSGSGEILVGQSGTAAHAIALHSRELAPEDLPRLLKEELEKADG